MRRRQAKTVTKKPYPSGISEDEWHFMAPYLTLVDVNAPQRRYDLREVFNALRWLARAGAPWRLLPYDLPPWQMVCQQLRRWNGSGCFEAMVSDMRSAIRLSKDRQGQSSEVILEGSHQNPNAELFWHLNDRYIGSTHGEHKQSLLLPRGAYLITILDEQGNSASRSFEVVSDPSS